ncbi:glycoside hydrolase family 13 protein [Pluteus cervinus]|uniref:Glycoside hydrolase family 13 protein n=1 Tax=Pluteus cervinus TaxID=181527 RepID=A0ACD3AF03_9AGAR|nr:glycoside hydrolase family 13 protein [Pluteus cervinus]
MLQNILLLLALGAISGFAASADDWKGRSIYQLLTDRFANTNDSSASCNTEDRRYCGGSWQGVINHLDYIQGMGFDAVWISPIVKNLEGNGTYGEAYHGYWAQDINALNSHFGTEDDLKALSSALHARGMFLMVDVVVNHFGALGDNNTVNYADFSPFSTADDFHPPCLIDYTNQSSIEQCWIGDSNSDLPDLNTESQAVVDTMNTWIGQLVHNYSVDGLRVDTVKHVRQDFWPNFAEAAGVFTLGEVLSDNLTYTAAYTGLINAVLDYPTWFPLTAAFTSTNGSLSALKNAAAATQSNYKGGASTAGLFLENQDQPRFQSITKDQSLVQNAMAWPFVFDGIPILYYGQEQGYDGNGDPNNREALWFTAYQTQKPLVSHVTSLNAARKAAISSNKNFLTTAATFIDQQNSATLAISKPPLLALLTNSGNASTSTSWQIPASAKLFSQGEKLVNVLTCTAVTPSSDGSLAVQAQNGLPQIILPASALDKNGNLCKDLATGSSNAATSSVGFGSWVVLGGTLVLLYLQSLL